MSTATVQDAGPRANAGDNGQAPAPTSREAAMPNTIRTTIFRKMRRTYPWMKLDAIRDAADRAAKIIPDTVTEQTPKMTAAKSRTGFLSLSGELRNRIYEYALISTELDSEHVDARNDQEHGSDNEPNAFYNKPGVCSQRAITPKFIECGCLVFYGWKSELSLQPGLTQVCRQTRNESLPIYYGRNEFLAYSSGDSGGRFDFSSVRKFLLAIGKENAARIRRFTVLIIDGAAYEVDADVIAVALNEKTYGLRPGVVQICVNQKYHTEEGEYELLEMSSDEHDSNEGEQANVESHDGEDDNENGEIEDDEADDE